MKKWVAMLAVVAALVPVAMIAADPEQTLIARFDGGIGVDPVRGTTTFSIGLVSFLVPTVNTVRSIAPGGAPWVIRKLKAKVAVSGALDLSGRGLVLSATDAIGTADGVTSVRAILFCGPNPGAQFTSASVPLSSEGDFTIDGFLSPTPPTPCTNPALLVVTAAPPRWLAAGIPDADDN
jgi:hypothetical protein